MDYRRGEEKYLNLFCFFTCGLANLFGYSLVITASEDILSGLAVPSSLVVICISGPASLTALTFPFFFDKIGYPVKVGVTSAFGTTGLLIVVLAVGEWKLAGVCFISTSACLGAMTFFGMTVFYKHSTVSAYCAGTGSAIVLANLYYLGLTVLLRLSPRTAVLSVTWVPLILIAAFTVLKKPNSVEDSKLSHGVYRAVSTDDPDQQSFSMSHLTTSEKLAAVWILSRHIIALFIGYFASFLALQGIVPSLVYRQMNLAPREVYVLYSSVMTTGNAIGRSYSLVLSLINPKLVTFTKHTWALALVCTAAMLCLLMDSWYRFSNSLVIVNVLLLTAGLFLGALYLSVLTMAGISDDAKVGEFSRSFAVLGWEAGMTSAGLLALYTEPIIQQNCLHLTGGRIDSCLARSKGRVL